MGDDKLPAIQFYPGDWKKDPGIRVLTFEERGVWFELLLLMHEAEERGKLVLNGKAYPIHLLASSMGLSASKLKQILAKLLATGVASKEPRTGVIFNRRMVRDNELRKKRARAGSLGGKQKAANKKAISTPSSSSSSSTSSSASTSPSGGGPAAPSASAPVSGKTNEIEEREVFNTACTFDFCATPGMTAKQDAIKDLRRIGLSHEFIRSVAGKREAKDFFDIVRSMSKGKKGAPEFKPSPTVCTNCGGTKQVAGGVKDGVIVKVPCPRCPPADAKATG